ncbi:hypothetical protein OG369_43035 [Streptomyces sp. NBC_01221]|uniref:hypothetical protein n=1 Tax=Streptomyces sp. NBC_01221 TaxID=2903782 RepID=UPI0022514DCC|nr:hypothetical protein [Streptomyces sp. NBC_01221]MCX4792554.1 hypothetical protein [Streptomyces sp. NBC_01221]
MESLMYRIAIVRKGQPADRRTAAGPGELRDVVYGVIRAEGSTITDADHSGLIELIGSARDMADIEGFAGLEFGAASITIRPATPSRPEKPGKVTPSDVRRYPAYYIAGDGRAAAEASSCDHGYRVTDSCPCCP